MFGKPKTDGETLGFGDSSKIGGMATRVRSYSKVNLGLAVGGVRADGYHSLVTLDQTEARYDRIMVSARPARDRRSELF